MKKNNSVFTWEGNGDVFFYEEYTRNTGYISVETNFILREND